MKLYQVRKGQFVYYNNQLHKVYGIKAMYKQSIHLIRLRDLTQHLAKSAEVERYKPKELDSFNFNQKAYTLRNRKAEEGDYILIHNPRPDSLDTYFLNEIEMVEKADNKGIITTNSHGVKHNEYLLMEPGRDKDSYPIDFKDIQTVDSANLDDMELQNLSDLNSELLPSIGDIYKKNDNNKILETMVIAISAQAVYLGGGLEVSPVELMNDDNWEFLYNLQDYEE
ncbi:hypothetical protein CV093_20725 [Oceanobacillus sp. 143]|uniref:Uncharacterized protein n=1 Tax=Oceanobacillus zhaokaii TaxID=2052660 RepID=A0A345PLQ4_9BACI|nr:hypothetical protein [Oceanobacillus zhaokaii]AXI10934.1 hypothetical protein CUC15_19245 [Oceanobacillus zhaokaii]QGS69766.1 hypothetical protein CV093_20725 [Oceanobacillus sp. 143]